MQMKRVVGEKGQVVIPKDARDYVGIKPGSEVVFEVKEGAIVMRPQMSAKEWLEDFLNVPKVRKPLTYKDIRKAIEEEYDLL